MTAHSDCPATSLNVVLDTTLAHLIQPQPERTKVVTILDVQVTVNRTLGVAGTEDRGVRHPGRGWQG